MTDINEVRERLERLAYDAEHYGMRVLARPEHVRALLDDHARLQADASRYSWLRDNWGRIDEVYEGDTMTHIAKTAPGDGWFTEPASLDAAIDAAKAVQS